MTLHPDPVIASPVRAATMSAALLVGLLGLAGCGGNGTTSETGGGAGDTPFDPIVADDIQRLSALAGVYLLADDWRGDSGDVAYLVVDAPDEFGVAPTRLIDVDETDSCSERARIGTSRVDRAGDAPTVFLDDLFDFDAGVIVAQGDGLAITHADVNDRNGDGTSDDRVVTSATRVAASEADVLPPACR